MSFQTPFVILEWAKRATVCRRPVLRRGKFLTKEHRISIWKTRSYWQTLKRAVASKKGETSQGFSPPRGFTASRMTEHSLSILSTFSFPVILELLFSVILEWTQWTIESNPQSVILERAKRVIESNWDPIASPDIIWYLASLQDDRKVNINDDRSHFGFFRPSYYIHLRFFFKKLVKLEITSNLPYLSVYREML